ncbi:MAG: RDD family protein [Proteobacteria bacterium]|nr:RDD family protein [Pseudomonadota bacterium]
MSDPLAAELTVDSATGIDVTLPVAGAGARALAFVIDWCTRAALATTWWIVAAVIVNGNFSLVPETRGGSAWYLGVVLPSMAIYFLYHPILEPVMRGSTPGKRRAGIHIVTRQGGTPGIGALLVRNVFRLVDSLPGFYGLALATMLVSKESLRFGDMAAGTLLVYDHHDDELPPPAAAAERIGVLDPTGAEIVADLLSRWDSLEPGARIRLARALLQRYLGAAADLSDGDDLAWRSRLERMARPHG